MRGLRHGMLAVAVLTAALVGSALPAGATVERRTPATVAAKAKKPKKPVSTCKLLTVAEITQALGTAPTEPAKADSVGECDYSSPTDYNFINISVTPLVNAALWKKSAQSINVTIPVAGIGDAAYRNADNGTILVRKGKQTLRIDQYVVGLTEAPIESLGKAATARL